MGLNGGDVDDRPASAHQRDTAPYEAGDLGEVLGDQRGLALEADVGGNGALNVPPALFTSTSTRP